MNKPKISVYIVNTVNNSGLGDCLLNVFGNIPNEYLHTVNVVNHIDEVNAIELLNNYKTKHKESFNVTHAIDSEVNLSKAYNFMISQSSSEVALFVEPNVHIRSNTVQDMLNLLYKSNSVGVVGCSVRSKYDTNKELYNNVKLFDHHGLWYNGFKRPVGGVEGNKRVIGIPYQAFAIKTSVLKHLGGFDTKIKKVGMELDLCLISLTYSLENFTIIGKGVIEDSIRGREMENPEDAKYFFDKWLDKGEWTYAIPE
jgi:GT2 family glycosyltransferase